MGTSKRQAKTRSIKLSEIRLDGGTQGRFTIDDETVAEYATHIQQLPPVGVVFDGTEYWLWDGFHRYHAHVWAGLLKIDVEITRGSRRDAVLASLGANTEHGLRRSAADKRKAIATLLDDATWGKWNNEKIASICNVGRELVRDVRAQRAGMTTGGNAGSDVRLVEWKGKVHEREVSGQTTKSVESVQSVDCSPDAAAEQLRRRMNSLARKLQELGIEVAETLGYDPTSNAFTRPAASAWSVAKILGGFRSLYESLVPAGAAA